MTFIDSYGFYVNGTLSVSGFVVKNKFNDKMQINEKMTLFICNNAEIDKFRFENYENDCKNYKNRDELCSLSLKVTSSKKEIVITKSSIYTLLLGYCLFDNNPLQSITIILEYEGSSLLKK